MVFKPKAQPSRLKVLRAERGVTQAAVAKASKVSQTRICLIERGELTPRPEDLKALARVLGVAPSDIWQVAQ